MTTPAPPLPARPEALSLDDLSLSLVPRSFIEFLRYVHVVDDTAAGIIPVNMDFPVQRRVSQMLQQRQSFIWLKERQIGATKTLLAPYALWIAMFQPAATVGVVSAKEVAVKSFMRNVALVYENLPQQIKAMAFNPDIGVTQTAFGPRTQRSQIIAYTSAPNSGVGETMRCFIMDEAAEHEYARENWETVIPAVGNAQIIVTSTSNPRVGPSGFFYDKWRECTATPGPGDPDPPAASLIPLFTGRYSRPDRNDANYYEQKLRELGPRVFAAYYPRTPEEAFQSQEGLVYQEDFDPLRNVARTPERPLSQCETVYVSYDLGGGDPTAMQLMGTWRDVKRGAYHIHCYAEHHKQTGLTTVEELAAIVAGWERTFKAKVDHIVPDHNDLNFAKTWRNIEKRVWYPESKARMRWLREKGKGLTQQAAYLRSGQYTISDICAFTIGEYSSYYWLENTDQHSRDHYATGTPSKHHADHKDAERYALMAIFYDFQRPRGMRTAFKGWG